MSARLSSPRSQAVPRIVVALTALWVAVAGWAWGTWSAGSADAHGYISQAELWLEGDLIVEEPMAASVPWDDAQWAFAPLGYRPGLAPDTLVPVYPVGLPLVMAGAQALGGRQAVFLVVPFFGVIAVLATARFATHLDSAVAGAVAAVCLAASPTFLFSLMWPMSDVPAAALWVLALVLTRGSTRASAFGAGASVALAVLTRPNLVLVALAPAAYLLWRVIASGPDRRLATTRLLIVGALASAGCLGVAAVHTWLYGAPLATGYGHATQIYDLSRLPDTASGFVLRPLSVEPALIVLAASGLGWYLWRPTAARPIAWLTAGTIALVLTSYAFYVSFPEWWYVRLLLPAWPPAAACAGVGAVGLARLAPSRWQTVALLGLTTMVVGTGAREAVHRGVFGLREAEARYETVARFVTRALPPNALLFSFQQSGALRYYANRPIIRFDVLPPRAFNDALNRMRGRGYRPYFVVEDHEAVVFKARFRPESPLGYLDWPPLGLLEGPVPVRIYDPADRDRTRRGEQYPTFLLTP